MKAELYKRLFRAIFSEDIPSLKKIAFTIIQEERKLGHTFSQTHWKKSQLLKSQNTHCLRAKKAKVDYLLCPRASVQIHNWYRIFRENN